MPGRIKVKIINMLIIFGLIILIDGVWSYWTPLNRHNPGILDLGRAIRTLIGLFIIIIGLILRFNHNLTWACIQPEESLNKLAKMAYQNPGILPGLVQSSFQRQSGNNTNRGFSLVGTASWYSKNDPTDPWVHKTTASGEPFNEDALTCAMRRRDFGREYKVTNMRNGKSVVVKHTDFGPALKYKGRKLNRVIDLSKAAFAAIEDLDVGVVKVRVEEL